MPRRSFHPPVAVVLRAAITGVLGGPTLDNDQVCATFTAFQESAWQVLTPGISVAHTTEISTISRQCEHLQKEVLRPDVVGLAIQETTLEIEKLTRDAQEMSSQREGRKRELEAELRNLATAVAKGSGNTSFLLEAIAERETELREIKRASTVDHPKPVQLVLEGLEDHVMGAISDIRELARIDVPRAKVELGKHVDQIVLTPQPDHSGYLIEGQWNLVGTDSLSSHFERLWRWNGAGRGS